MTGVAYNNSDIVLLCEFQSLLDIIFSMDIDSVINVCSDITNISGLDIVERRTGVIVEDGVHNRR
jgi:hypothetical protein